MPLPSGWFSVNVDGWPNFVDRVPTCGTRSAKFGWRLAGRQAGRVAAFQLRHLGVGATTAARWTRAGHLHQVLPRVYAVGHVAPSLEAELWAAVLYAGPDAALSHVTAAHWRDLADFPGPIIHVSTPRACASLPGIAVHGRRARLSREIVDGMPITTLAQTVLDVAAATPDLVLVRKLLAEIEYQSGSLDVDRLRVICGRGRRGSVRVSQALGAYDPRLAHANGRLELGFYVFCERRRRQGIPLPELNVSIHGVRVDAYFRAYALVVELDGDGNHRTPAQRRRDRRKELILRARGIEVVRYDWALVEEEPSLTERDLLAALARREELLGRRAEG
jgi:very-short-patch-repair endonuclease